MLTEVNEADKDSDADVRAGASAIYDPFCAASVMSWLGGTGSYMSCTLMLSNKLYKGFVVAHKADPALKNSYQ